MQGKAEILWKYNYYAVVYEHFDKPYFGVLGTIIQIIRMTRCVRSCTESGCCRFCSSKVGSDFSECKTVCISIFFVLFVKANTPTYAVLLRNTILAWLPCFSHTRNVIYQVLLGELVVFTNVLVSYKTCGFRSMFSSLWKGGSTRPGV